MIRVNELYRTETAKIPENLGEQGFTPSKGAYVAVEKAKKEADECIKDIKNWQTEKYD